MDALFLNYMLYGLILVPPSHASQIYPLIAPEAMSQILGIFNDGALYGSTGSSETGTTC